MGKPQQVRARRSGIGSRTSGAAARRRLRVALVSPYSVTVPGGVQNQVLGLAHELRRMDHHVSVLAPVDGETPPGVTSVGRSITIATNGSSAPVAPYPTAVRRTLRILRRGAFDVVHLHEPFSPSITIPVMLARPAPLVGTFHAAGDQPAYRLLGRPFRLLARRLEARAAVSETAASPVRRYLGGTYEVLFNGVDIGHFDLGESVRVDPPAVLFLGRDDPRKGLGVLLDALALLPPELTIWIAGPGTDEGHHRDRHGADSRIRWLGELTEAEKVFRLQAASVVCVPSLQAESFGIVLLEAMAAGTPIVASDLRAYRSLTDGGRAAQLVTAAEPSAIADGVLRILRNRDVARAQRTAGLEIAERYGMRTLAERYIAIYEATVARAAGQPARS